MYSIQALNPIIWLSGSCRDGWKDMGVWGGLRPPHTPNFLPLPAIPREPELEKLLWMGDTV